jgi:hypothetical protein
VNTILQRTKQLDKDIRTVNSRLTKALQHLTGATIENRIQEDTTDRPCILDNLSSCEQGVGETIHLINEINYLLGDEPEDEPMEEPVKKVGKKLPRVDEVQHSSYHAGGA